MKPDMSEKFIVGNWKMHTTAAEATRLAKAVVDGVGMEDRVCVGVCPPFPYLALVGEILKGSRVSLGAQNLYPENEGAFTGEVSPMMLLDLGCKYVILGHSERRQKLGESDAFINQKVPDRSGARSATHAGIGRGGGGEPDPTKYRIRAALGYRKYRSPSHASAG